MLVHPWRNFFLFLASCALIVGVAQSAAAFSKGFLSAFAGEDLLSRRTFRAKPVRR